MGLRVLAMGLHGILIIHSVPMVYDRMGNSAMIIIWDENNLSQSPNCMGYLKSHWTSVGSTGHASRNGGHNNVFSIIL